MVKTARFRPHSRSLFNNMGKKKHQKQFNLYEQLAPIMEQYSNQVTTVKELALDKASDYFVEELKKASPVKTGELKDSWTRTKKYKGVRYVGNTAVASKNKYGYDIPLTNIIEYSSKGNPFIRKTFEENKEKIINIIKETIENGDTK